MSAIQSFLPRPGDIQRLYDWIFEKIQPFINGRVFETHSANGELSSRLIANGFLVQLNAKSEIGRQLLHDKFKGSSLVRGIHIMNFTNEAFEEQYSHFEKQFSTVLICDNVDDQINHDIAAINKAKRLVSDGGRLIVVGQCPTTLLPGFDQDITLLKQYNRDSITRLLNGFTLIKIRYFNFPSACFVSIAIKS